MTIITEARSLLFVPGTRAPPGRCAPGTTGPSRRTHAGKFSASIMQARLSIRQSRAVAYASSLTIAVPAT